MKFICQSCGSHQLSYQQYVKSVIPVMIDQYGNISYKEPIVDHDDDLPVECGFVCRYCGCKLYHAGEWIAKESDLIWYLTADPSVLAEHEQEYQEYLEEQVRIQEEKEVESISGYQQLVEK